MSHSPNRYSSYLQTNKSQYGDNKIGSPERENIVSVLKNQVFELQQNEKSYNALHSKYKALGNDYSILNEEKLRLEYELKQKTESTNKIIGDLQNDNENLQNSLNEKHATNCSLYNDNNNLFSSLEAKTAEVESLRDALSCRDEMIDKLNEEKRMLERNIANLTDIKGKNESTLQKQDAELEELGKICENQERSISALSLEKKNLTDKLDSLTGDHKNLSNKLKSTMDTLQGTKGQLENAEKSLMRQGDQLNETEAVLAKTKNELAAVSNALVKEKGIRSELEMRNDRLEGNLKERIADIKQLTNEADNLKMNLDKTTQDRNKACNDIEKYTAHIMFLTQTNQKLTKELEGVIDRDDKIKQQLTRNERIIMVLNNNRQDIDTALNQLESSISRQKSPTHK